MSSSVSNDSICWVKLWYQSNPEWSDVLHLKWLMDSMDISCDEPTVGGNNQLNRLLNLMTYLVLILKITEFFRTLFCARYAKRFFFVVVEVGRIARSFTFGQKRRLNLCSEGGGQGWERQMQTVYNWPSIGFYDFYGFYRLSIGHYRPLRTKTLGTLQWKTFRHCVDWKPISAVLRIVRSDGCRHYGSA